MNLVVAGAAMFLSRERSGPVAADPLPNPSDREIDLSLRAGMQYRTLILFLGISGFLSFGCEPLWTRSLITILGNSSYAFTTMLVMTLVGLTRGGAIASRLSDRIRKPLRLLGFLEAAIGCSAVIALPVLTATLYREGVQAFFFAGGRA